MAQLSFDGIQPVGFGGKECTPKINTELRLRLRSLKFETDAETEEADKVLAECFKDDEKYVAEFLASKMTPFEKQQLQAYLIAGPSGIRLIDETITNTIKGAANE